MLTEEANRFRRVAPPLQTLECRQPRVIPSRDMSLLDQLQKPPLAHDRLRKIEPRELDLLGMAGRVRFLHDPVIKRAMVLKLQGAEGMSDPFDGIGERMSIVVGRIDAPGVPRSVMSNPPNAIQDRIPHVDIGRGHVNFGP